MHTATKFTRFLIHLASAHTHLHHWEALGQKSRSHERHRSTFPTREVVSDQSKPVWAIRPLSMFKGELRAEGCWVRLGKVSTPGEAWPASLKLNFRPGTQVFWHFT